MFLFLSKLYWEMKWPCLVSKYSKIFPGLPNQTTVIFGTYLFEHFQPFPDNVRHPRHRDILYPPPDRTQRPRIDLKKSHHNNFLEKSCDEREKDMQMKCLMFQVAVFVV